MTWSFQGRPGLLYSSGKNHMALRLTHSGSLGLLTARGNRIEKGFRSRRWALGFSGTSVLPIPCSLMAPVRLKSIGSCLFCISSVLTRNAPSFSLFLPNQHVRHALFITSILSPLLAFLSRPGEGTASEGTGGKVWLWASLDWSCRAV